jgi:hypothetical protein
MENLFGDVISDLAAGLVGSPCAAWCFDGPVRHPDDLGPGLPRRRMMAYKLVDADGGAYASAVPGTVGGHRRAKLYGRLDCPSAQRAIAAGGYAPHRVFFADEQTAVAAGYRPCAVCMPDAYARWKAAR